MLSARGERLLQQCGLPIPAPRTFADLFAHIASHTNISTYCSTMCACNNAECLICPAVRRCSGIPLISKQAVYAPVLGSLDSSSGYLSVEEWRQSKNLCDCDPSRFMPSAIIERFAAAGFKSVTPELEQLCPGVSVETLKHYLADRDDEEEIDLNT